MKLKDAVVLVTGANRGLGLALARAALAAGASKVYAGVRQPADFVEPGIVPVRLDVTRADDIGKAATECQDVDLLINNAGISKPAPLLSHDLDAALRAELETNLFGPLAMARAFSPTLAHRGGGAIVNILSVLSWLSLPGVEGYCVSKSAAWSMTNGLRNALRNQGTLVQAVHVGYMDTDMTRGLDAPKAAPDDVAHRVFTALANGEEEVCADELSQQVQHALSSDPAVYLRPAG